MIIHKRQVFRCAPEQLRASTTEERQLVRAPHAELLGLKHAFEAGQIASRQYVDLINQEFPPQEPPDEPMNAVDVPAEEPQASEARSIQERVNDVDTADVPAHQLRHQCRMMHQLTQPRESSLPRSPIHPVSIKW